VIKELKQTAYLPITSILGSRDQYCVKKEFAYLKGPTLISSCIKAVKGQNLGDKCVYFKSLNEETNEFLEEKILDIEELKSKGRLGHFCPYFHARRAKDYCDLLLLPYNYLLEPSQDNPFNIDLKNCIVIFDEAHNIS